ncbi:MAG TPA: alpha/beta fold hydrolase, partial [Treponemataceae bacterium]|nr:alpha/beta fold hydrolase [Treponemataceae bacterium]
MTYVIFLIFLIFLGVLIFSFSSGNILFLKAFKRSNYEKKSFVNAKAHVRDLKIMTPIFLAKKRWNENKEKREIKKITLKDNKNKTDLVGYFWTPKCKETNANSPCVILVHGFSDTHDGMAYLAEEYNKKGFYVLLINLRGHGESAGQYSGLGYVDAKDIIRWINYLEENYNQIAKIVLHGVSMGAATAIQVLFSNNAWNKKECIIAGVVADCPFADLKKQIQDEIKKNIGDSGIQKIINK